MDLMRLSTCTYPMRDKDAETALGVVAKAGFKKVDLWGKMPHFSADPGECDHRQLAARAENLGVKIANLGTYPGAGFSRDSEEDREAAVEELFQTLQVARQLGVRSVRVRPGEGDDPAIIDRIVPYFQRSARKAEELGIYMGIENHAGNLAGNPDACIELCEKVGSKYFGVLYEPCNLAHGGVDYKEAFERFSRSIPITHVHIKDGAQRGDKFERTMLGDGDIDVRWVVEKLLAAGYEGDLALEYEVCDIEAIETGLAKWLDTFQRLTADIA